MYDGDVHVGTPAMTMHLLGGVHGNEQVAAAGVGAAGVGAAGVGAAGIGAAGVSAAGV